MMNLYSFIAGKWSSDSKGKCVEQLNPYTGERTSNFYYASREDVELALTTLQNAQGEVASLPTHERYRILMEVARLLNENQSSLAEIITMETGKALKNSMDEVSRSVETFRLSAEEANRLVGETMSGDVSTRGEQRYVSTYPVPVGTIAAITPFNAPLNLACHKIGPAFAAGNTIVYKPAEQTPRIAKELIHILLEAGFPKNGVALLFGDAQVGEQIVKSDKVSLISFTGGVPASEAICKVAGIKKVLLELGGNAATIVHDDAPIEKAAKQCVRTGFSNAGQSCISVQRIYVHENVKDVFLTEVEKEIRTLRVGDPMDAKTDVGTLISPASAERILTWIHEAQDGGATLLSGGEASGAQVKPTVLVDPPIDSRVVCEEVFGPVICLLTYTDINDVIEQVNASPYGLQAGLFTNQLALAHRVSLALHVGGVQINNTSNYRLDHLPYGGVKKSGIGKEGPRYAIQEMVDYKMIVYHAEE
ncbi:aldehyde dehydrogenase family protein [Shouchella sp. 1P09AA]|uniref:aldehyde dehydrogenase family protein n=1 Tax=unclassified Shouchella TaxID=2893065 RepID=UPI0039A075FB